MSDISTYLWQRLPLILLFAGGYFIYQLMVVTRITDAFVSWVLRKSRGNASVLLLYVIGASAALSSFIPNTITVLTLLPMLKRLDRDFARQGVGGMTTVLMCSAIYGAAIGGMGSMIGSPANALLIGVLDFYQIAGREQITFFNWFLWSVPLVILFVLVAWGVVAGLGLPPQVRGVTVHVDCLGEVCETTGRQRYGSLVFWFYMGFWILEAVARQAISGFVEISPLISMGFFGLFIYLVFFRSAPTSSFGSGPLLRVGGLLKGLPRRGFLFILGLVALFWVIHSFGIDRQVVLLVGEMLQGDMMPLILFFLTIVSVIFLTELLSNTAVVAAFFTIAYYAALGHDMNPMYLMMGVGVASTCAFMTPIATPTNALAFGEMKGASLTRMLGLGFVLNVAGAILLTVWLSWALPLIY
ncbi:MAG: sodium:sulfate symporter [Pseudodesulfovibrio sp.]|nr:sodium:sulfate symporter [Pseudodesulfovibrio sp.]